MFAIIKSQVGFLELTNRKHFHVYIGETQEIHMLGSFEVIFCV